MPLMMDGTDRRVARLEGLVASLEARIRALEQTSAPRETTAARDPALTLPATAPLPVSSVDLAGVLALLGRTFVVLAGAYLLRAAVEADTIAAPLGVWLGMAYAGTWLAQADRSARAARRVSALFHGGASVLIAMPLLAEAATRFHVIAADGAAVVLAAATSLGLLVSARARLQALAWITTVGAVITAGLLIVRTGAVASFSVSLIAIGIATLWLGYQRDWFGLRWLTAPAADLAVIGLTMRALTPDTGERPATAMAIQFLLLAAYLATVTVRTLVRGRDVIPFEVAQTAAALAVGLGGAVALARATTGGDVLLGLSTTVCALGCYVVALLGRHRDRRANLFFYGTLGLILMMVGTGIVLPDQPTALVWLGLAVAVAWTAPPCTRLMLLVHAGVYALAAALLTGVLGTTMAAFLRPATEPLPSVSPLPLAVVLVAAVCFVRPVATVGRAEPFVLEACRVVLAVLFSAVLGGMAVIVMARALTGPADHAIDPGALATIRTAVLSASALLLAVAGRLPRLRELGWLLYPVLAAIALKLVTEDVARSRPAMLFIALAAYGGALILAPRVARRAAPHSANAGPGHRQTSPRS